MNIALGCDHGGWPLKEKIKNYLDQKGYDITDCGTFSADSCDYSDFAYPAAKAVAGGKCVFGIVVCTTGVGVSIVANKVSGVRCALCTNADIAKMTRAHNNSNMLALGAKYTDFALAKEIIDIFVTTPFEGGRHEARVNKITLIDGEKGND